MSSEKGGFMNKTHKAENKKLHSLELLFQVGPIFQPQPESPCDLGEGNNNHITTPPDTPQAEKTVLLPEGLGSFWHICEQGVCSGQSPKPEGGNSERWERRDVSMPLETKPVSLETPQKGLAEWLGVDGIAVNHRNSRQEKAIWEGRQAVLKSQNLHQIKDPKGLDHTAKYNNIIHNEEKWSNV